jgi:hypothetical protein
VVEVESDDIVFTEHCEPFPEPIRRAVLYPSLT